MKLESRIFPGTLELDAERFRSAHLFLCFQAFHQTKKSARVAWILAETFAQYAFCLCRVSCPQQSGAKRLANGVVPGGRFVVSERVL